MATNKTYQRQVDINNTHKLRELLRDLPMFVTTFFRGIEPTTSSRTRIAYAYDIRIFFNFIKSNNPVYKNTEIKAIPISILDQITVSDIEEYLDYLKDYSQEGKEYSNYERGIMRKLATLKSFYNYYYRNEYITTNPASIVKMPKLHQKEIVRLDVNEVSILLDQVESGDKLTEKQKVYHAKTKTRDLAMLSLLLGTGIRVSECVGLDITDVDFDNCGIKVHRKGGYEAIVYFSDEVSEVLSLYVEERGQMKALETHENALFLSLQNKRISVRSVENLVKKYSSLVTTLKKITPHKLRSTYGTNLYRETQDIYLVADVLGHKDVNTTRKHYAALEDERRRSARNKVILREDK